MVDDIVGIFTLALIITGLGIVVAHGAAAAQVITATTGGFANIQRAAQG